MGTLKGSRAYLTTPGFEAALVEELARAGSHGREIADGAVLSDGDEGDTDPVFSRQVLPGAKWIEGGSVRALAEAVFAAVDSAVDNWPGPFSLHALTAADPAPGFGSRVALVGREALALLAARRRRAWRRYRPPEEPPPVFDTGRLLIQLLALDRDRLLVSVAAPRRLPGGAVDLAPWPAGEAPVALDREPPSRAYQKLEEAFAWMGRAPKAGQRAVDLGAAPGGWTATLVKRGARVTAVDRAPLEAPLARHERVTGVIGNAFTYVPPSPVDWLVSDVVCEPRRSLDLVASWLERRLARNLVVTVKFKGRDGYGILAELPPLLARSPAVFARTKHLAHNKNEVTVMVALVP